MANLKRMLAALLPKPLRIRLRRANALRQVHAFREQDWEWSAIVRPLIRPGDTVVDVGANIGYLTRLFAGWVGDRGRVLAVEPVRETFEILRAAHEGEHWKHVFLLHAAFSDTPGGATMVVPKGSEGVENFYEAVLGPPGEPGGEKVEKRALDEMCRHLDLKPGFIKIDVEGHELEVLRGAMETLMALKPALLIEVKGDPESPHDPAGLLFRLLMDFDYMPHVCTGGRLAAYKPGDRFTDVLFLTAGHGRRLEEASKRPE